MKLDAVTKGMAVRSADGEKVGVVISRGEDYFTIEKGILFKKDYIAREGDIAEITDDGVRLLLTRDQLESGMSLEGDRLQGTAAAPYAPEARATEETTRVPLAEEELVVEKTSRQVGEVRVHKDVRTEEKEVSVPVTREEVRVERVPVAPHEARADEATFTEGETKVPVHEEEVELRKRPVVREEVRVSRTPVEEQRVASATVRREEAEVESEGDVQKRYTEEDPNTRK